MVTSILMCIGVIIVFLAFLFLSIRAEINIRYRGDLRKDYNLAGKWGATLTQGSYDDFIKDFRDLDNIILYDSECFISSMKYIPMWDNDKGDNYDFIRIIPQKETRPFEYPKEVCKVIYKYPLSIPNCVINLQQFELGSDVNKDKLYPLYQILINTDNENIAYNIDKRKIYILTNNEVVKIWLTYTRNSTDYKHLYFIHSKNMQNEREKLGTRSPWTFNMERTREKSEIVTIIPRRIGYHLDGFELTLTQQQEERFGWARTA